MRLDLLDGDANRMGAAYGIERCEMLYLLFAALKFVVELCDDLVGQHRGVPGCGKVVMSGVEVGW
jgi:hypothetical protein